MTEAYIKYTSEPAHLRESISIDIYTKDVSYLQQEQEGKLMTY